MNIYIICRQYAHGNDKDEELNNHYEIISSWLDENKAKSVCDFLNEDGDLNNSYFIKYICPE